MSDLELQSSSSLHQSVQWKALLTAAACILLGVVVPGIVGSEKLLTLLTQAVITAVLATSVGTLFRFSGVISFGHAAFYGLGVYVLALGIKQAGLPAELAIVLALIVPTALAFIVGLGFARISGAAFAMMTLAIGQALFEVAMKARGLTSGEDGFHFELPATLFGVDSSMFQRPGSMFMISWTVLVLVLFGLSALTRTSFGRVAMAIRDNEERARFIGYTTRVRRAAVFALSASIAALSGVLFGLYAAYTSPNVLTPQVSGEALIMAVIGGAELVAGPAFGAMLFFFFKDIIGDYTEHWQAMIGLFVIVATILLPRGVGGLLQSRWVAIVRRLKG